MSNRLLPGWILILVFAASGCAKSGSTVVARVGSYEITRHEAELRDEVISVYFPNDKRHLGLQQLIQAYTAAEILKRHGHEITPAILDAEEKRIDSHTLMPEKLNQLRAIFGEDHQAYRRVFILPVLAERVIYYEYFLHDPEVQKPTIERAQSLLSEAARSNQSLKTYIARAGATFGVFHVSREHGIVWDSPESQDEGAPPLPVSSEAEAQVRSKMEKDATAQADEATEHWIEQATKHLKPGNVFPQVVDQGENWQVVRYRGHSGGRYDFEAAVVPKLDYGKWLQAETEKVRVEK